MIFRLQVNDIGSRLCDGQATRVLLRDQFDTCGRPARIWDRYQPGLVGVSVVQDIEAIISS